MIICILNNLTNKGISIKKLLKSDPLKYNQKKVKLDNSTIINYLEYSDYPEQLQELLKEIEVSYVYLGTGKHFEGETEERVLLQVYIKRSGRSINFKFGMSIHDTNIINIKPFEYAGCTGGKWFINGNFKMKFFGNIGQASRFRVVEVKRIFKGLLYSILVCCKSEYYCALDFDVFCSEFGYNNDSIKDKVLWERCLKQAGQLQRIFKEEEIDCLPS